MEQHKIERINALAKKSKAEGLTPAEQAEQKTLRDEYIAQWRNNLKSQLDNATVLNPDGTTSKLQQRKDGV